MGTDFYPTLLELAGVEGKPGEHPEGISLVTLLKGESIQERPLFWHYPHYGNQGGEPSSVIRRGEWKLIHYYEDGREELYNLKSDQEEVNNLSDMHPDLTRELSAQLFAYLRDVGARFPTKDPQYSAGKEEEHLKKVATERLANLEKQRKEILSKDFDPGNNWWGSKK